MHVKHCNDRMPPMEVVRSRVAYDPDTGAMTWRSCGPEHFQDERAWRIWTTKFCGKTIGKRSRGYVIVAISYQGRQFYLQGHRVAWALHYGEWPTQEVDHRDGCRENNRISNLRNSTHLTNQWNKGLMARNKSGFKGVHQHTQNGSWVAQFRVPGGKTKHLGSFPTPELAALAYRDAAHAHHQQFARFK